MPPKRKRSPSIEFVSWRRMASPPFNVKLEGDDDLTLCTPQNAYFHVSAALLSLASPYFKTLVRDKRRAKEPLQLDVEESQTPLEIILRLTYPLPDPIVLDFDDFTDAYKAALKYQLEHATVKLQGMLPRFMEREPLRVYAIAIQFGLDEETELAAYHACKLSVKDWPACEEFDHIPASRYHDLFLYHKRRGAEAVKLVEEADYPYCKACSFLWLQTFKETAGKALLEAPTNDRIFTFEFLAKAGVHGCKVCTAGFVKIHGVQDFLLKLNKAVASSTLKVRQA